MSDFYAINLTSARETALCACCRKHRSLVVVRERLRVNLFKVAAAVSGSSSLFTVALSVALISNGLEDDGGQRRRICVLIKHPRFLSHLPIGVSKFNEVARISIESDCF
jgi:hypothetical protein